MKKNVIELIGASAIGLIGGVGLGIGLKDVITPDKTVCSEEIQDVAEVETKTNNK